MSYIKKVAAIHDISCFGRASLTTIIPILSVMKYQVCPMPTAVLSTHTGGFGKPAIEDLSNFMNEAKAHWGNLEIDFKCIYSGYLGNANQVDFVKGFIRDFKKDETIIVVDPVMADDGKLYSSMDTKMVEGMRELVKDAHIITPNITEACFLLDIKYKNKFTQKEIESMLIELSSMGPKKVVITSVPSIYGNEYMDTVTYDKDKNEFFRVVNKRIEVSYPGTGDAFASVLIGGILKGDNLEIATKRACNFIKEGIEYSNRFEYPRNYGMLLEEVLCKLME